MPPTEFTFIFPSLVRPTRKLIAKIAGIAMIFNFGNCPILAILAISASMQHLVHWHRF